MLLYWAILFFIVALVAAVFGFSGLAHDTAYIGKILAIIGIVLSVVSFMFHRRSLRD